MRTVNGYVLVEPLTDESVNGVVLPYKRQDTQKARVISVSARRTKTGKIITPDVHPGDVIIHEKYVGQEVERDGKTLLFLPAHYILAVVK